MEKIKSRWRNNYLNGVIDEPKDDNCDTGEYIDTNNKLSYNKTSLNSSVNSDHDHHHNSYHDHHNNHLNNINSNHNNIHHNHHNNSNSNLNSNNIKDSNNIDSSDTTVTPSATNNHHNHHKSSSSSSKHSTPPVFEILQENLYLDKRRNEHRNRKDARSMVCDCILTKEERARGVTGCLDDCLNRMLMIECGSRCSLGDLCLNKRFQKFQSARVEVFKTRKKGWGLRTVDDLPTNSFIMEYVGEVVRSKEFKSRVKKYTKQKIKHHYFMALQSDEIIDATVKGNYTRFINHSCEPNCETQKWTVNGELRIGFFTIRNLQAGEEITFDYQFQRYGRKAQKCYCEAPSCRGYIGGNEQPLTLNENSSPARSPGFKIPRLNPLQRMEIEKKLNEELNCDDINNDQKPIFSGRNYFKFTTPATTNGFSSSNNNFLSKNGSQPIKRRFDSTGNNNIDLTPEPKISKEQHRQQFEMHVRLKAFYDDIEKQYGPAAVEQIKLSHSRAFNTTIDRLTLTTQPPQPNQPIQSAQPIPTITQPIQSILPIQSIQPIQASQPMSIPVPLQSAVTPSIDAIAEMDKTNNAHFKKPKPTMIPTVKVLANYFIEPAHLIDDDLAFSICGYDKYYKKRKKPLSVDDVNDHSNPYPGSYYTTPDGETWFATVTLDRKTQQPNTVIFRDLNRSINRPSSKKSKSKR